MNADLISAAAGDEASEAVAIHLLRKIQGAAQITCAYTLPQTEGRELITALLPVGHNEYKSDFANAQMAIAGAAAAADLITTAGFDPPAVFCNLDNFVKAVPNRGAGFCDPFRMALAP